LNNETEEETKIAEENNINLVMLPCGVHKRPRDQIYPSRESWQEITIYI
jgi:hypothetical protein